MTALYEQLENTEQRIATVTDTPSALDTPRGNTSCEDLSTDLANGDNPLLGEPRPVLVQRIDVRTSGSLTISPFTSNYYQRLPHPLSHLLKQLPVVDGGDVGCLFDFLRWFDCLKSVK
jgi:hypothetical protein